MNALIAIGGTGGHVFPGYNLANHLMEHNYKVNLVIDKRGSKFLKNYNHFKVSILPSSPLITRNLITILTSFVSVVYSVFRSFIFLIFNRPSIIFGMGGYASFPICIAASILQIKFIIYENNLILGKANKYLLPFANRILVSYKDLDGIPEKYLRKTVEIGNIIKKEIINFQQQRENSNDKKLKILVLGGSQAAKIFAETLPNIFKECSKSGILLKIYQHCLPSQNEKLKLFYKSAKIDFETFNFSHNLNEFFSKVNLAITRSGSSMLAELTNVNLPFISVPLPTSADNHQLKNSIYYKKKNFAFLIEEKDLSIKLFSHIKEIYENRSILDKIKQNQRQYSDKNVYNNINQVLKEILDGKN